MRGEAPAKLPIAPTRSEAFRYWLRLGCVSFGGPAGQIAIMHRDLVETKRWISESRFLHALNYCMLLPGPEAMQLATYIGWLLHRTWGGIVAGGLFVLPSLVVLIALSWLYMAYGHLTAVAGVLYGVKPAIVAIVLHAAWRIGRRALKHPLLWAIAAFAFVAIFVLHVAFPIIVLAAAAIGALGGRFVPRAFASSGGHSTGAEEAHAPALIDDDTPTPDHARFRWTRLGAVVAVALALYGAAFAMTTLAPEATTLPAMAWFFTKAALLTFGGAYAVLPYVYQGAVETYGWLVPSQMIDGLALGETTPGPLIMIVAFVGYVGGWTKAVFGGEPQALALAGIAGALVATWFTFLPSFVFILLGGPLIESTHGRLGFTAPLTGITAAVVGVIASLAAFFAYHVLWPSGLEGRFDLYAAAIAIGAAIALFRFGTGVIPLIGACGLVGLAITLARTLA